MSPYRLRRTLFVIVLLVITAIPLSHQRFDMPTLDELTQQAEAREPASIRQLAVKGRAPKTGYERRQFGDGWSIASGCDTRNRILARDLLNVTRSENCKVLTGLLKDPYTGSDIRFSRGAETSDDVQIDHVVALSNAWQTGAQLLDFESRVRFANDPLNLLAVSGPANEQKSDGDAATWLPSNTSFRCAYVNRQIEVKSKYGLWLTPAEKDAMVRVLAKC